MVKEKMVGIDLTNKVRLTILNLERARSIYGLCKITNTTYCYQLKLIHKLEDRGFITVKTIGRERNPALTEKGEKLKRLINDIQALWLL